MKIFVEFPTANRNRFRVSSFKCAMIHGAVFWSDTAHPAGLRDPLAKVEGHAKTFPAALSRRNRPSTAPNFAEIQTMGRNGRETFASLSRDSAKCVVSRIFSRRAISWQRRNRFVDAVNGACGAKPQLFVGFQRLNRGINDLICAFRFAHVD